MWNFRIKKPTKKKQKTKQRLNSNKKNFSNKIEKLVKAFTKRIDPFMLKIIGSFQIVLILQNKTIVKK